MQEQKYEAWKQEIYYVNINFCSLIPWAVLISAMMEKKLGIGTCFTIVDKDRTKSHYTNNILQASVNISGSWPIRGSKHINWHSHPDFLPRVFCHKTSQGSEILAEISNLPGKRSMISKFGILEMAEICQSGLSQEKRANKIVPEICMKVSWSVWPSA